MSAVTVLRDGRVVTVHAESVRFGDVICDRFGVPLRNRRPRGERRG